MAIFVRKATTETLAKTRAALAREETAISALRARRAEQLAASDDIQPVTAIDRKIEQHRLNAAALRDKIPLIEGSLRQQAADQREDKRRAAIAAITARLKQREADAVEPEAAIARVVELLAVVAVADDIRKAWPFPWPQFLHMQDKRTVALSAVSLLHRLSGRGAVPLFGMDRFQQINSITYQVEHPARLIIGESARLIAAFAEQELPEPEVPETDGEDIAA